MSMRCLLSASLSLLLWSTETRSRKKSAAEQSGAERVRAGRVGRVKFKVTCRERWHAGKGGMQGKVACREGDAGNEIQNLDVRQVIKGGRCGAITVWVVA